MLKLLALHCQTGFGPTMHGSTDALKNTRSVAGQGTAIRNVLQQFLTVSTPQAYTKLFRCPQREKSKGFRYGK
jgi:hypothetical protein